jgi:hypothetical protein
MCISPSWLFGGCYSLHCNVTLGRVRHGVPSSNCTSGMRSQVTCVMFVLGTCVASSDWGRMSIGMFCLPCVLCCLQVLVQRQMMTCASADCCTRGGRRYMSRKRAYGQISEARNAWGPHGRHTTIRTGGREFNSPNLRLKTF